MEELETIKNIITLPGLENSDQILFYPLQTVFSEHINEIVVFWWVIWYATLLFLLLKFIILPLIHSR